MRSSSQSAATNTGVGEALFRRLGSHYILVMMLATRVFGSTGGLLVVYYIEFIVDLREPLHTDFRNMCFLVTEVAVCLTLMLACWETRCLRPVLRKIARGEPVSPEEGARAGYEAVDFAARHHRHEAWLVPASTALPVLLILGFVYHVPSGIMINITLTVFMATAMALMAHYFAVDFGMQPVIRTLLDNGVRIDYGAIPQNRLMQRMRVCFTLIVISSALMTGTMARQRAADIITAPDRASAVRSFIDLRNQSIYIMIAAAVAGVALSSVLAHSIVDRLSQLVQAMEAVGRGVLSVRAHPTGNDEVDRLARQFNTMVQDLERNDQVIRDLNLNLECKVSDRTQALEKALAELQETQSQLTDLARSAGMAEVATGVLHNVGNVLNSVNISTELLTERIGNSRATDLERMLRRLTEHRESITEFLGTADRAPKLLEYLERFAEKLDGEQQDLAREMKCLAENVEHIKGIIAAQQGYARRVVFREEISVPKLVREVLAMHGRLYNDANIELKCHVDDLPAAWIEKAKLFQILDNLVRNAVEAMGELPLPKHTLTVCVEKLADERARITVTDTGAGVRREHLQTIFTFGFTTKPSGNGFGLHSSALAIADLGGTIRLHSEGPGRGASFVVELPLRAENRDEPLYRTETPDQSVDYTASLI